MANALIALIQPACGGEAISQAHQGVLSALRDTGLALCLFEGEAGSGYLLDDLRRFLELHRPKGVILLPPLSAVAGIAELCREAGCRPIRLTPDALDGSALSLCSNDRQAAADMTQYLIALGHQRIGFVAGSEADRAARERELGYLDALATQGLDRGANLVAESDGSFASGQAAGHLLLEVSPRPTAIFAASDELAAGVLHAAHEQGISVPLKLSVAGFGDSPVASQIWPQLTSMRLPFGEMGFAAAIELITSEAAVPQPVEFFGSLVRRSSTGPVV